MIRTRFPELSIGIAVIKTEGDRDIHSPLSSFGGRGAFVRSIESALVNRDIDIAVHSLKDLPSRLPEGLILGAAPVREDPRDALAAAAGQTLSSIPGKGTLATGSDRRRIQLLKLRPGLSFTGIRGNIESRLRRIGRDGIDGVVLAFAGLKRLALETMATQVFDPEEVLPAPCQGALGLECREDDPESLEILREIENDTVRACVDTERAFIAELDMGCHAPVAAFARTNGNRILFSGLLGNAEGNILRRTVTAERGMSEEAARTMAREFRETIG